jgi:hypothetical protein
MTFYGCTGLKSITLKAAETIVQNAFLECTSLTSIYLPNAINIEMYAFQGCTSLTEVSMPKATTFGEEPFRNCTTTDIALTLSANEKGNVTNDVVWKGSTFKSITFAE